jgi:hypothetical protein
MNKFDSNFDSRRSQPMKHGTPSVYWAQKTSAQRRQCAAMSHLSRVLAPEATLTRRASSDPTDADLTKGSAVVVWLAKRKTLLSRVTACQVAAVSLHCKAVVRVELHLDHRRPDVHLALSRRSHSAARMMQDPVVGGGLPVSTCLGHVKVQRPGGRAMTVTNALVTQARKALATGWRRKDSVVIRWARRCGGLRAKRRMLPRSRRSA